MVPAASLLCMGLCLVISFAVPFGLLIYLAVKKKAQVLPFFVGCAVMIFFAFILEGLVHRMILGSSAGASIRGNTLLYALYAGLMAGVFEECGRWLAMKTVLRNHLDENVNAFMYGAGHGGIEAIMVLGIASINNLTYSVMINTGTVSRLTESVPPELLGQVEEAITALQTTPAWQFLMGGAERIFAILLHLALSVFVWFAVKNKDKRYLFPFAILVHALVDGATVILSEKDLPIYVLEAVVAVLALAAFFSALRIYRKEEAENAAQEEPGTAQG